MLKRGTLLAHETRKKPDKRCKNKDKGRVRETIEVRKKQSGIGLKGNGKAPRSSPYTEENGRGN